MTAHALLAMRRRRIWRAESLSSRTSQPRPLIWVGLRPAPRHSLSAERILGESDHPLPDRALEAKFAALVDEPWSGGAASAWRDLARIDEISDIRQLIEGWCATIKSPPLQEEIK